MAHRVHMRLYSLARKPLSAGTLTKPHVEGNKRRPRQWRFAPACGLSCKSPTLASTGHKARKCNGLSACLLRRISAATRQQ